MGDSAVAITTASSGTGHPTTRFRAMSTAEQLPGGHAEGHQGRMFLALDGALAGQSLANDRQPDERGERGEDPPPDGLRVDGRLDRRRGSVLARGADATHAQVQSVAVSDEGGDAGRTASKADQVFVLHSRVREHRALEPRAGIEEIDGGRPGRELDLACFDTDYPHREVRTARVGEPRIGVVVVGRLGRCFERDVDHGSHVHPVLLQRGRCQHLVGPRGIGQLPGNEREGSCAPSRHDGHAEVVVADLRAFARRIPLVGEDQLRGRGHPGQNEHDAGTGRVA